MAVVVVTAVDVEVVEEEVAEGITVIALVHRDVVLVVLDVVPTPDHVLLRVVHQYVVTSSHVPTAQWPKKLPTVVATAEMGSPLEELRDQDALSHAVAAGVKCIC